MLAMETFWLMVTVAVAGGLGIPLSVIWIKHREKLAEIEARRDAGRTRELEDRMKVLEQIVTDKGYDVSTQIEALRDTRRGEDLLEAPDAERTA